MESVSHIGIDLAWGPRNRTGIAAVAESGALVASATVTTDDEIVTWVERHAPRTGVVALDAPLVVANREGSRPCEQQIQRAFGRFDAGGYPSNTSNPNFHPPRALTLARRLGLSIDPSDPRREHVAIEVYPHPAMVGLFELGRTIKYKRKQQGFDLQLRETRRLLDLMDGIDALRLDQSADWGAIRRAVDAAEGPGSLGKVEDEIDGIFCAHLAWLWAQRSTALQVYGDVEQGYIVAPPPPTWAPTPRSPRVPKQIGAADALADSIEPTPTRVSRHRDSHVFVTRGDLLHVACDAWLLPTDRMGEVTGAWLRVPGLAERVHPSLTPEFQRGEQLATPVIDWPEAPTPILTAVPWRGVRAEGGLEHVDRAVRDFVAAGAALAVERPFAHRRPVPLLAMPIFATGAGGGGDVRGEVLRTIIAAAREAAAEHGVDVAIVVRDAATFAHAQLVRRTMGAAAWPALDESHWEHVDRLATLASGGRLVPFMGAGVSVSAGGPLWRDLIASLASEIGGLAEPERASLLRKERSELDQAAILEQRLAATNTPRAARELFRASIAEQVRLPRYGLAPALLATLAPPQAITLNYDTLYEDATRDVDGTEVTVIADRLVQTTSPRWLLKLHGTVDKPDTIVLTRDDYLGYSATRNALSSIVKANLITHHLLFVGFGFADDHFHQIVHDVHLAVQRPDGEAFATAIQLEVDPLDATLLRGTAVPVSMAVDAVASEDWDVRRDWAGRQVEIVLDALVAHAADSHDYLLDDDFASALTDDDRALKAALRRFVDEAPVEATASPAWAKVAALLRDLGHESDLR